MAKYVILASGEVITRKRVQAWHVSGHYWWIDDVDALIVHLIARFVIAPVGSLED